METPNYFSQFFMWLGPYKWPMLLLSVLVILLVVKKAIELMIPGLTYRQKASGINAILFWGSISMALGIFSQTVSLWAALREIMAADDISPVIVLIGYYGSFISTLLGTATLIFSALAWWLFRYLVKRTPQVT